MGKGGGKSSARGGGGGVQAKPTVGSVEATIRNQSTETAVVFDENGNVIINKDGGQHEVQFSKADVAAMKDGTLTHNHPSGGTEAVSTFSPGDIALTTKSGLHEMRAVTESKTYSLTKVTNKRARNDFATDYRDAMRREGNRLSLNITSNKAMSRELTKYCSNWLKTNSSKYGYNYTETTVG